MPVLPQITLAGNLMDLSGTASDGSMTIRLCNFDNALPKVPGTGLLAPLAPMQIAITGGSYNVLIFGNDVISPSPLRTFYVISIQDENGTVVFLDMYQFTGTKTVDLSTATPYVPPDYPQPPPPPPQPTYIVFTDTVTSQLFSMFIANGQRTIISGGTGTLAPVNGIVLLDTGNGNAPVTMQITNGAETVVLGGSGGVPFFAFNDALTGAAWQLIMILYNGLETPDVVAA